MRRGGKRKGAGRKPSLDKKIKVDLYIETSIINQLGGIKNAKVKLYNFAKIEAEREIIKTVNNAETSIKSDDKCNMHFVSTFLKCGWIYEFDDLNIICILRKDYELDEELTIARNILTDKQNDMVCSGAVIRFDKSTGEIQFMLKDGINWC